MKRIICSVVLALLCTLFVGAKRVFTDVVETEYYSTAVRLVSEMKLMEGTTGELFSPDENVSVAQAITVASRICATYCGDELPGDTAAWYQRYVDYAIEKGIVVPGQFDAYTRDVKRHEVATLFARALSEEYYTPINEISVISDVPSGSAYYSDLLKLYRAGILVGNDRVGRFYPEADITRAEFATVTARVADENLRLNKEFIDVMPNSDAHELVYSNIMMSYKARVSNGWLYDNKNNEFDSVGSTKNVITEYEDDLTSALYRDFDEVSDGILSLEMVFGVVSEDEGAYVGFADENENVHVKLTSENGKFKLSGMNDLKSDTSFPVDYMKEYVLHMDLDLDKNIVYAYLNGEAFLPVKLEENISLSRLVVGTTKEGKGSLIVSQTHLMQNYASLDRFLSVSSMAGKAPYLMDTTGNVTVREYKYEDRTRDIYSAYINAAAGSENSATKTFPAIDGDGIFETYLMLPNGSDGAYFALMSDGEEIVRIESKNGAWYCGEQKLRDFTPNVWQTLRIVTDYNDGTADLRINGKKTKVVGIDYEYIDAITVGFNPTEAAVMWFDDVSACRYIEHSDYPSYPSVAESTNYNIGVHRCDLWRDADSGEGWDSISAFPDLEPVLGYYDEGTVEVADWEIKMMVEHGIDFQHIVWYPNLSNIKSNPKPMKTTHNGGQHLKAFMDAKYSDLMDFAIIFCCEDYNSKYFDFESFKNYIWPYWVEHFFLDDRYMRLDNKAVISFVSVPNFINAMGGTDGAKECLDFMREDIKNYGYDGMIILGNSPGNEDIVAIGCDGNYTYNYNSNGASADYQINYYATHKDDEIYSVPTISVGFNDVGRTGVIEPTGKRTTLITPAEHQRVGEYIRDTFLPSQNYGDWRDNTVFISTWNEYSEGTYVSPAAPHGYGYLESIRNVFTNDTSSHENVDVTLTDAQKSRISKLYPSNQQPIRRLMLPEFNSAGIDTENLSSVKNWTMNSYSTRKEWSVNQCTTNNSIIDYSDKTMEITATGTDPFIYVNNLSINTSTVQYVHVRMKTTVSSTAEVYYRTDINNSTDDGQEWKYRLCQATTKPSDQMEDYYFPISETEQWEGTLTYLRLDPISTTGSAEIELIELVADNTPVITVKANGNEMEFDFAPKMVDGDIKVTANPNRGFFSRLNLFYTWDRFTGKLMAESKDTRAYFTVGSSVAVVNGTNRILAHPFELVDGLPVFYLNEFCDIFGTTLEVNGNTYNIKSSDRVSQNDPDGQWNFNLDGYIQGWRADFSTIRSEKGFLVVDLLNSINPIIINDSGEMSVNADDYSSLSVRLVVQNPSGFTNATVYFATKASSAVDAQKSFGTHSLSFTQCTEGYECILNIPLVDNGSDDVDDLTGQIITKLRLDLTSRNKYPYKVDYIRFVK